MIFLASFSSGFKRPAGRAMLKGHEKFSSAHYAPDQDAFVTVGGDGEEFWQARTVTISDGSRLKVYGIGAGAWTWEAVD